MKNEKKKKLSIKHSVLKAYLSLHLLFLLLNGFFSKNRKKQFSDFNLFYKVFLKINKLINVLYN